MVWKLTKQGIVLITFIFVSRSSVIAQDSASHNKDSARQVDVMDIIAKIFKKEKKVEIQLKKPAIAILPSLGYNPSFGFIIGAKITGGKQFGDPSNTNYSVFAIEGMYTSKGIISVQAKHNIFTAANKWNWQGQWQFARYGLLDYGIGTGNGYRSAGFALNEFPTKNADSAFPIQYGYIRLSEKGYRNVGKNWYVGAGVKFDFFSNIKDKRDTGTLSTPHYRYSLRHDFDPKDYAANGLILAVQYNTREHPIRSYGGTYAELGFQFNQTWMGSTKNAIQLQYDFRKYWSLSKKNPEHVIAVWHWAVYTLSGDLPYLEMPSTASDPYGRSGRAYTFSRFKGPSYADFEAEWRFPITRNKLLSGVGFVNFQTASDDINKKVFQYWEPGGGVGLRILFQKISRTTLCVDFARGRYGSNGIFFGLGEAF